MEGRANVTSNSTLPLLIPLFLALSAINYCVQNNVAASSIPMLASKDSNRPCKRNVQTGKSIAVSHPFTARGWDVQLPD